MYQASSIRLGWSERLVACFSAPLHCFSAPLHCSRVRTTHRPPVPTISRPPLIAPSPLIAYLQFVEKDPKLAEPVLLSLLRFWPLTNSQKEVRVE